MQFLPVQPFALLLAILLVSSTPSAQTSRTSPSTRSWSTTSPCDSACEATSNQHVGATPAESDALTRAHLHVQSAHLRLQAVHLQLGGTQKGGTEASRRQARRDFETAQQDLERTLIELDAVQRMRARMPDRRDNRSPRAAPSRTYQP